MIVIDGDTYHFPSRGPASPLRSARRFGEFYPVVEEASLGPDQKILDEAALIELDRAGLSGRLVPARERRQDVVGKGVARGLTIMFAGDEIAAAPMPVGTGVLDDEIVTAPKRVEGVRVPGWRDVLVVRLDHHDLNIIHDLMRGDIVRDKP